MYNVKLSKKSEKFISKQDKKTRDRLIKAIMDIAESPFTTSNVKKLSGETERYRKRVGDFRIVYKIIDEEITVHVVDIDNRGDIYKHL